MTPDQLKWVECNIEAIQACIDGKAMVIPLKDREIVHSAHEVFASCTVEREKIAVSRYMTSRLDIKVTAGDG